MPKTEEGPPRRRPATSDIVGTIIVGAVGAVATVMGLGYGFLEEDGQVGAGFLPVLCGAFIVVASLLELGRMVLAPPSPGDGSFGTTAGHVEEDARAAMAQAHQEHEPPDTAGDGNGEDGLDTFGRTQAQRTLAILQIFGIMLVALLLIPVLGLLLSMSLMTLTLLMFVERKPWLPSVLATAGAFVFFYVFFVQVLSIPVPTGMLGIV